ncbi:MAG: CRISPR-associated protein Cas4 [Anaerolineales bacterium]|nr:CRISPR-associated protein Cas4 [Anaerolineales bacterium]
MEGEEGDEERLVPLSAIESYAYCPRQCALVHVEQSYADNLYTLRGIHVHERVHAGDEGESSGYPALRSLTVFSDRLGLIGQADLVELRPDGPYPVEYKAGRIHRTPAELQLCGQALCLEEMYAVPVPLGAIYRAAAHTRREVSLDASLRALCETTILAVRGLLRSGRMPPPTTEERRCRGCSVREACLPDIVRDAPRLRGMQSALFRPREPGAEEGP